MKWLWLLVLVLLVVGGWWYFSAQTPVTSTTGGTSTTTSQILSGVSNKTYSNTRLSFTLQYPGTMLPSQSNFDGFLPLTQTPVASFTLPREMFAGTNLAEAGVYIGATTTPAAMQRCESPVQNGGETIVATTTLDSQDFASFTASDAGAGNLYESKIFRTYQNGACLEIVELLHSGNIGNYPAGTVVEFDKAKYQGILDAIVRTYQPVPTGI